MPRLKGKSILVTGGAGFIGSHLVDRLISERPGRLVVVDNFFLGKDSNLRDARRRFPSLRVIRSDATRLRALREILAENATEIVFHLAVVPLPASLVRPRWASSQNIQMSLVLCELLRQGRYRTLIQFSSSEVYGTAGEEEIDESHPLEPRTPYAASKAAADQLALSYARTFGAEIMIIRPFNAYGPRQNEGRYAGIVPLTVKRILDGKPPIIFGDGFQTRDYSHVSDIADAAVRLSKTDRALGRVVQIGSGVETRILDLVRLLRAHLRGREEIRW